MDSWGKMLIFMKVILSGLDKWRAIHLFRSSQTFSSTEVKSALNFWLNVGVINNQINKTGIRASKWKVIFNADLFISHRQCNWFRKVIILCPENWPKAWMRSTTHRTEVSGSERNSTAYKEILCCSLPTDTPETVTYPLITWASGSIGMAKSSGDRR